MRKRVDFVNERSQGTMEAVGASTIPSAPETAVKTLPEQNEVMLQLTSLLRCTLSLLRVVGVFEMSVAVFYAGLVLFGLPPVQVEQVVGRSWLGHAVPSTESASPLHHSPDRTPTPLSTQEWIAQKAAQSEADMTSLLSQLRASNDRCSVTVLGRLMLLFSVGLFALGGRSCFKAYRLLVIPDNDILISSEPTHSNEGLHSRSGNTSQTSFSSILRIITPQEELPRATWPYVRSFLLHPLLNHRLLMSLSVWPTVYWLLMLHIYHRDLNMEIIDAGGEPDPLYFGLSSRLVDLMLAAWQPLFHWAASWMINSIVDARNEFVRISKLRYTS